jgi:hypothetical protein
VSVCASAPGVRGRRSNSLVSAREQQRLDDLARVAAAFDVCTSFWCVIMLLQQLLEIAPESSVADAGILPRVHRPRE